MNIWKPCPEGIGINPAKTWHRTWQMYLTLQLLHLVFTEASSENGLGGRRVAIKKAFLKKGEKRLRYPKLCKNKTENQWWQVFPMRLYFKQCCWRLCQNLCYVHMKVPSDFDPTCNSIWKASDWQQLYFPAWQWSQTPFLCSKAHLDRKTHNGALLAMDWPPQSLNLYIFEALWDLLKSFKTSLTR